MSESVHSPASRGDTASRAFVHPGFAFVRDGGAPSIIVQGAKLDVVWANRAAGELFQTAGYDGLQKRLIGQSSLAMRVLSAAVQSGRSEDAPRLLRLRFAWGSQIHNLLALCGRGPETGGEPILELAFIGSVAEDIGRRSSWSDGLEEEPRSTDDTSRSQPIEPPPPDAPRKEPARPPVAQRQTLEEKRETLWTRIGGAGSYRFVWQTDADGMLVEIDQASLRKLGLPLSLDAASTFAGQIARFDPSAAERLSEALASQATWGGIKAFCPVLDGSAEAPLSLAGSPQFDAARRFTGFRGFSRLDPAQLRDRDRPEPVSPDADATAAGETIGEAAKPPVPPMIEAPSSNDDHAEPSIEIDGALASEPPSSMEPDRPADQVRPDAVSQDLDRSANVVQLWPVHVPSNGRGLYQGGRVSPPDETQTSFGAARDSTPSAEEGDLRSKIEAAVGQSLERKGALSSSEHQAFQEIGRTLGAGPRRGMPPSEILPEVTTASNPGRNAETDLTRHAAALIDTMAAGLLVIRNRGVLFANEALRDVLRYDNHSDLLDALALYFTRLPSPAPAENEAMMALPSASGETVSFNSASRIIAWNNQPAVLWTLSRQDNADGAKAEISAAPALPAPSVPAPSVPAPSVPAPSVPVDDGAGDLSSLLDAAGEAIAVIDPEGLIVLVNRQAEVYFGRERGALAGADFTTLLAGESRAAAAGLLNQVRSDPSPRAQARGECVGRSADGSSLPLEMRIAGLDQSRFAIVWRDLSAQRGLERELAQARRHAARAGDQQPDFLANVSHQVRTPLNAIIGFAEIMMDERFGPLGNPRYKDYLKDIHMSGAQVIALIDDLTDLSRIEAGRLDLRLGAIDINKIIVDCVAEAHALAHRERVIVRTSFGARLPPVMADERSARQIIGNLLSNAIKFNEPGGQVIVSSASADSSAVVVRIRDTGIGMSDSDIAAALEPFKQLATTKNATGTGLGLPLTKALVGANGASLTMRSRPNEGTMVEVTFQATVSAPTRVPA